MARNVEKCGTLPVFADDGLFMVRSNSRISNQSKIEQMFVKIRMYLNSNGLEINAGKTGLTEYMVAQKRAKIGGKPPELMVEEKITDNGYTMYIDKQITDKSSTRLTWPQFAK